MSTFRHADGRIMVAVEAGGVGGGVTSVHHRLATAEEEAAFLATETPAVEVMPEPEAPPPNEPLPFIE